MKLKLTHVAALGLSAALVAGYVGAQTSTTPTTPEQTQPAEAQQGFGEFGRQGGRHGGMGFGGGFGFGRVALDTTLSFSFYTADPETGATPTETLEFTYGVDSETAFAEQFQTARASATFMKVDISEQNRSVDLSTVDTSRGIIPRELSGRGGLNDGSTLTATFYNGDPDNGGTVLQTLTYTQGTSSEAGFADDFSTGTQDAAFVTISTSPQTYTVDLSAMPQRGQGFGPGHGFGHHGHGFGSRQRMNNDLSPINPNNSTPANPEENSDNS
jgi:hypothetical protein